MTTDLLIKCVDDGYYDMSIDINGDFSNGDFFDTSLLYSLLGERRASESEVALAHLRRGWIGNENKDFENGSKLWLFSQSRINRTIMNAIADAAYNGLLWLIQDGYVVDVKTTTTLTNNSVSLRILIERFNGGVDEFFFPLWENTGVSNAS